MGYRVTISRSGTNESAAFLQPDLKIVKEVAETQLFFRRKLDGKITAYEGAFDLINNAPFTALFDILIEELSTRDFTYSEYLRGQFKKIDCEINEDDRAAEFEVTTVDRYQKFIDALSNEYNILERTIEEIPNDPASYTHGTYIQVATRGYIDSFDSINNQWNLITNSTITAGPYRPYARHFARVAPEQAEWVKVPGGYAKQINNDDPNITDTYDGVEIRATNDFVTPSGFDFTGWRRLIPNIQSFGTDIDPPGSYPPFNQDYYIPNTYPFVSEETTLLNRAKSFWDVLKYLIGQIDPTITFDTTEAHSNFLFAMSNPVTAANNRFAYTRMIQKSDATTPFGGASRSGVITFAQMVEVLNNAFNAYWFIDDQNRFRIEHRNYFDFGGIYYNINNPGIATETFVIADFTFFAFPDVIPDRNSVDFNDEGANRKVFVADHQVNYVRTWHWAVGQIATSPNKPFKLSITFHFEDWQSSRPIDTIVINYGGNQKAFNINTNDNTPITIDFYSLTADASREFVIQLANQFDLTSGESNRVEVNSKLIITDANVTYYDIDPVTNVDLKKYISLMTVQNLLEDTNAYTYDVENLKRRFNYKWAESYEAEIRTGHNRRMPVDTMLLDFTQLAADESDLTEWIPQGEESINITNFVTNIDDFLTRTSQNLNGWILLDCLGDGFVSLEYFESVLIRNGGYYFLSLFNDYGRYRLASSLFKLNQLGVYARDDGNDRTDYFAAATLDKLRIQNDIEGIVLPMELDSGQIIETRLGQGELIKFEQNLNSKATVISLRYEH